MKTLKYIFMILLLAATAAGFASCSDDDEPDGGSSHRSGNLIGTWKADVSDQFPEQQDHWLGYIFYDDNKAISIECITDFDGDVDYGEYEITYEYDAEDGILRCWHGWEADITQHTNMIYTLKFTSPDSFIIDGEDVYSRVDRF